MSCTTSPIPQRPLFPREFRAEGLLKSLAPKIRDKKILLCRAKEGREILVDGLKKLKAKVDLVEAYRVSLPESSARQILREAVDKSRIDLVVFASSTMIENFVKIAGGVPQVPVACIGLVTAKTARAYGFNVAVVPKKASMEDLAAEISRFFG